MSEPEPVISVNGKTGPVVNLDAEDVEAISVGVEGQPSGVATLDESGRIPEGQLPSSVVSSSATPSAANQLLVSIGEESNEGEYVSLAQAGAVARANTALNMNTDFSLLNEAEPVTAHLTNEHSECTIAGAKASWIGFVACGEGIQRGTTITAVVGEKVTLSHAATLTGTPTINIGPDCSAAFEAAFARVAEPACSPLYSNVSDTHKIVQAETYVPAGRYIVTKARAPMNATVAAKGYKLTGAGRDATTILFAPTEENAALARNHESWFWLTLGG